MPSLAVLGMHRSYTSLAARWLASCGIDMGGSTLGAGIGNEHGHFEDVEFLTFHTKILAAHGLSSNGMADWGGRSFDSAAYRAIEVEGELAEEGRALLERKRRVNEHFGWKEPRTCLFLPFYREALDPFALILFRPFEEVVSSLLERERRVHAETGHRGWRRVYYWATRSRSEAWFEQLRSDYLEAWIHYNQCLLDHVEASDPGRYMVHDLASMVANDGNILERLNHWGFDCDASGLGALKESTKTRELKGLSGDELGRAQHITQRFSELIGR